MELAEGSYRMGARCHEGRRERRSELIFENDEVRCEHGKCTNSYLQPCPD